MSTLRLDEAQPPSWASIVIIAANVVAKTDGCNGDEQRRCVGHDLHSTRAVTIMLSPFTIGKM